jgi:hypothetical protein
MKTSPVAWTSFIGPRDKCIAIFDRKYLIFFLVKFLQLLVLKSLDPDPHFTKLDKHLFMPDTMILKILIFTKFQVPAPVLEPPVAAPVPEPAMPAAPAVSAPEPPAAPPLEEGSPAASTKLKDSFAQVCA